MLRKFRRYCIESLCHRERKIPDQMKRFLIENP